MNGPSKVLRTVVAAAVSVGAAAGALYLALRSEAEYVTLTRYRVVRVEGDFSTRPLFLSDAMKILGIKLKGQGGPYRISRVCDTCEWGPEKTYKETMKRVRHLLSEARRGQAYKVLTKTSAVFRVNKFGHSIRVVDTEGTESIDRVWSIIHDYWPGVDSMGIFNCRRISGSYTWSQHAWGNAWDITFYDGQGGILTGLLDRIAAYLRSAEMDRFVSEVIWREPNHYNHIHVSGEPKLYGTPPCA